MTDTDDWADLLEAVLGRALLRMTAFPPYAWRDMFSRTTEPRIRPFTGFGTGLGWLPDDTTHRRMQ